MTGLGRRAERRLPRRDEASLVARYARHEARKLLALARRGRGTAFAGAVAELLTGRHPLVERRREGPGRYRRIDVDGRHLVVDCADEGISRTLLAYGVHERLSTAAFERELDRLAATRDGPVRVLEIGANLGYYCTLEAQVLGDRARIYAAEPIPSNASLLECNLAINGYEDRVTVDRVAVGASTEPVTMRLSSHSNQHRVLSSDEAGDETEDETGDETEDGADPDGACDDPGTASGDRVRVRQVTGERLLDRWGVDPATVHVVRMDVEGYEREVLAGLESVLAAPGPTLLFAELHPLELSREGIGEITSLLAEYGFEVASAVRTDAAAGVSDDRRWHGVDLAVEDLAALERELTASDHSVELIVRK